MYKSQLFFKDVLWVVAVHTIKTSWKQKNKKPQYLTTLWERIHEENQKKTKNLEKTNKKQYIYIHIYIYTYGYLLEDRFLGSPGIASQDFFLWTTMITI